jgi:hypothetical protein
MGKAVSLTPEHRGLGRDSDLLLLDEAATLLIKDREQIYRRCGEDKSIIGFTARSNEIGFCGKCHEEAPDSIYTGRRAKEKHCKKCQRRHPLGAFFLGDVSAPFSPFCRSCRETTHGRVEHIVKRVRERRRRMERWRCELLTHVLEGESSSAPSGRKAIDTPNAVSRSDLSA